MTSNWTPPAPSQFTIPYSQLLLFLPSHPIRSLLFRFTWNLLPLPIRLPKHPTESDDSTCVPQNATIQHTPQNKRQANAVDSFLHRFTNASSYQAASQYSSSKAIRPGSHRESWLSGKDGSHYTPQGSGQEETATSTQPQYSTTLWRFLSWLRWSQAASSLNVSSGSS